MHSITELIHHSSWEDRMDRRTFVATSVGLIAGGKIQEVVAQERPSMRSRLLGVWTLTEAVSIAGSDMTPWLGRQTPITGTLMYLDSGWMSAQLSGAKPGAISRSDFTRLSPADAYTWLKEYYAYYARFEIDEETRVITHRVVDSLYPYEKGIVYRRSFELDGDVLTLLTEPREEDARTTFNRLVWKKLA